MSRLRWVGSRLTILISAFVITGLILEVGLRLFFPQPRSLVGYEEAFGLPNAMKANLRGFASTSEFRIKVETNSKRLRDREFEYQKPPGVFRILGLGDSFTQGHGVELEDAYLKVLERRLNEEGSNKYEVINAGVGNWGTADELVYLEAEGYQYEPDLILLGFQPSDFAENIIGGLFSIENGKLVRQYPDPPSASRVRMVARAIPFYNWLAQHSHLVNFVRQRAVVTLKGQ